MKAQEKVAQLQHLIAERLTPLIQRDYLYLDLPYHANLGDTLIWQGTLDFLKQLPVRCLYSSYFEGDGYKTAALKYADSQILLHGGGNFGDVWTGCHQYRKKVIAAFPNRDIIILPQTIYYKDPAHLQEDAVFFSAHPNVTICARDAHSYGILQEHFPKNKSLMVPDMAFCMAQHWQKPETRKDTTLFVMRTDHELPNDDKLTMPQGATVRDWPTLQTFGGKVRYELIKRLTKQGNALDARLGTNITRPLFDWYWQHIIRPYNVRLAVDFVQSCQHLYTTRMHAAILGVILGKTDITLYDNIYGKMSWFYDTWLSDVDGIRLLNSHSH